MSYSNEKAQRPSLANSKITATMTVWMTVDAYGEECLFGFAEQHARTGGLSWVLSTPVVEFTEGADRARTLSGRIYALGKQISFRELDEEGRVALRLLLSGGTLSYPGQEDDVAWVTSQKVARHLRVTPPPRNDPTAVERFLRSHLRTYLALGVGRYED